MALDDAKPLIRGFVFGDRSDREIIRNLRDAGFKARDATFRQAITEVRLGLSAERADYQSKTLNLPRRFDALQLSGSLSPELFQRYEKNYQRAFNYSFRIEGTNRDTGLPDFYHVTVSSDLPLRKDEILVQLASINEYEDGYKGLDNWTSTLISIERGGSL